MPIGDTGIVEFIAVIAKRGQNLVSINLSNSGLTEESLPMLTQLIESNSSLTQLILKGNMFKQTSVEFLNLLLNRNLLFKEVKENHNITLKITFQSELLEQNGIFKKQRMELFNNKNHKKSQNKKSKKIL